MNLCTVGKGLFGTHVTWEDIEEDMRRELHTDAHFGPNKKAENIGDGKGFMSRVVLVNPDWQCKDKDLPERFIVKIVTQLAVCKTFEEVADKNNTENIFNDEKVRSAFEKQQKAIHNAEATLYAYLKTLPVGKFPAPKIYYTRKFSESNPLKGYIIMEFMENCKTLHIYENISLHAMDEILRALAILEATLLKSDAKINSFTKHILADLYGPFINEKDTKLAIQYLRDFAGGHLSEKVDKLDEIVTEILNLASADNLSEELGMQRVVCHGDLWSANILWQNDGDDVKMTALIDFQTVNLGCPATDLVRVFSSCLSGKDRQEHWEELLEHFYDYLKNEIVDQQMPYSLEQLKESYRRFFPLGAFFIASMISSFFNIVCKNADEEQRMKSMDTAKEKLEALLDDIIFFHQRNLKLNGTKTLDKCL
ncbi:unnamed protein product [Cylicocyclus nassatus]|uniref:CHK kinase-like domain-containing protein n=1 Tax=Cylicocyclus nassatus TaxID=53992 RepID=A0AA36DKX6_CYLNA|nr:unnamed protein product [Cylicocyclus nassatus]